MAGTRISPEKITSPIQLMAAWFALIVLLTSILLAAAHNIERPSWAAGFLVIFSAVLIVLVLGCVILMLTKFRPHLQEGKEYAQWLRDQNKYSKGVLNAREVTSKLATAPSKSPQVNTNSGSRGSPPMDGYLIELSPLPDADKLLSKFKELGFWAHIYDGADEDDSYIRHKAIWVGHRVPARVAIEAIKTAVSEWGHLQYLELSNDGNVPPDEIHDQLYMGGSTSTAVDRGLKKWRREELMALDPEMTNEEFHATIRDKYSRNS